jgi:hypothetical protein
VTAVDCACAPPSPYDGRSPTDPPRALFIHPNTLRQRLDRIQRLTDLDLAADDLLSLELAIKVARLRHAAAGDAVVPR